MVNSVPRSGRRSPLDQFTVRLISARPSPILSSVTLPIPIAPPAWPARFLLVGAGLAVGAFSAGYSFNQEWATQTWPWPDGDFSHIFIGSILAAIAAIGIWIGAVGEWGALKTGGLSLFVMFGGCSIYLFIRAAEGHDVGYAIVFAAVAGAGAALGLAFRKVPIADRRLMPLPVRASFMGVLALLVTGAALLLARVQVFPWAVDSRTAVMFGCISLGSASYFASSLLSPTWHSARGGLVALLAYDLVLFPRYVVWRGATNASGYPSPTDDAHLPVLIVFVSVTGLLSIYYLFIDRATRGWSVERQP